MSKNRIKRIFVILRTKDHRHYGFRLIRCRDGKEIECVTQGSDNNILAALTHDGTNYTRDYFYTYSEISFKELTKLPCAGCEPEQIRAWVRREFRKLDVMDRQTGNV